MVGYIVTQVLQYMSGIHNLSWVNDSLMYKDCSTYWVIKEKLCVAEFLTLVVLIVFSLHCKSLSMFIVNFITAADIIKKQIVTIN